MFVSLRVMDRDLAMSSVHVSHRQTFSEWYIHKVQMVGSKCLILERICFVQLYKRKSLFWCVGKNARWKCMKGRQTFLNGEKSICNRHSFFQYKWKIRQIGKMSLSIHFFEFHTVFEQNPEIRFNHIPPRRIKASSFVFKTQEAVWIARVPSSFSFWCFHFVFGQRPVLLGRTASAIIWKSSELFGFGETACPYSCHKFCICLSKKMYLFRCFQSIFVFDCQCN